MKTMKLASLGLCTVLALSAVMACTETRLVNGPPATPADGDAGAAPTEDPLAALSTDWKTRAASYLDGSTKKWLAGPPDVGQNTRCAMSCHTTAASLMASQLLGGISSATDARSQFEERVGQLKAGTAIPFYGADGDAKTKQSAATESVLNAVTLGLDDLAKGGGLSATTKTALDVMWSKQSSDGSWAWLEFGLDPWETRNDWGTAMAALIAGSIPADSTSGQAAGITKIKSYVKANLGKMVLHDKIAVLWASGSLSGLLDESQADEIANAIVAKQHDDGSFALLSWGEGKLAKDSGASDGYATALAVLGLCKGTSNGMKRPEVISGLKWLAANQAADGSWPGRSVNSTAALQKGFMTDAATAYATIAISTCVQK